MRTPNKIQTTDIIDSESLREIKEFTEVMQRQHKLEALGNASEMFLNELGLANIKTPSPNPNRPIPNSVMVLFAYAHLDYLIKEKNNQN